MSHKKELSLNNMKDTSAIPLHLQNPWTQELYRQYQAELRYSPSVIALNEEKIEDAFRTLNYLHSDKTIAYLEAFPEEKEAIARRKKNAILCINRNKAIIAKHYASIRSMKENLIRFGFLDEVGNSLFEPESSNNTI